MTGWSRIVLLFSLAGAVAVSGCGRKALVTGKVVDIGQIKIKSIHARLFANERLGQQDSDWILLPARSHELIAALLRKPIFDEFYQPKITKEVCRLRITDIEGQETQVMIWYDYKRKILFSLDGQTPLTRNGPYESDGGQFAPESAALAGLIGTIIHSDEKQEKWYEDRLWISVGGKH